MGWKTDSFELLSRHVTSYLGGVREAKCFFQGKEWKFLAAGSGEVILCLHGFGSTKVMWRSFMAGLSDDYRIVSPEIPGLSSRVDFVQGSFSKHQIAHWLNDFLDAKGIDKVNLVGHAAGGIAAAYYTHKHPSRVSSLALINPPDLARMRSGDLPLWEETKLGFTSLAQVEAHINSYFYNPPQLPEIVKRFYMQRVLRSLTEGKLLPLIEKEVEGLPLFISQLRNIQQKTLLVAADHDVMSSEEWILQLANTIPNNEVVTLEQCGQRSLVEKPNELVEIYRNYLNSN